MRRWTAAAVVLLLLVGVLASWNPRSGILTGSAVELSALIRQLSEAYPAAIRHSEGVDAVFSTSPYAQDAPVAASALLKEIERVGRLAARLQEKVSQYTLGYEQDERWNRPLNEEQWANWLSGASTHRQAQEDSYRFATTRVGPFLGQWEPATSLYDAWANLQWDLQHLQVTLAVMTSIAAVLSQRATPGVVPHHVVGQIRKSQHEIIDLATREMVPWRAVRRKAGELRSHVLQGLKYAPEDSRLLALYQVGTLVEWASASPAGEPRTIAGVRWWGYLLALEGLSLREGQVLHDNRLVADARSFVVRGRVHETVLQRVARGAVVATDFLIPDPTFVSKGSKVYKAAKNAYLIGGDIVLATKGGKRIAKGLDDTYKLVDGGLDLKNIWDISKPFVMGGIPGVQIDVRMGQFRALSITTGSDGRYETPQLLPSTYRFMFQHEKYEANSLDVVTAPYWQNAYVDGVAVSFEDEAVIDVDVALEKRTLKALADHGLNLTGAVAQGGGILLCAVGVAGALQTFGASLLLCGVGAGLYAGGGALQNLADDPKAEFVVHDYREESLKPKVPTGPALPYATFRPWPSPEPLPTTPVFRAVPAPPGTSSTVFVVDVSPSMNAPAGESSRLTAAKEAVKGLIQVIAFDAAETKRPHRIAVVAFGGSAQRLYRLGSEYASAIGELDRLTNISFTNVGEGLATGLAELAHAPGSRTVILLTDGETNLGQKPAEIVAGPVSRAVIEGITVHTVGFGLEDTLLSEIAARTGGDYVSIHDSFSLQSHYLRLRHQAQGTIIGDLGGKIYQGETKDLGMVGVGSGNLHATLIWPGSDMDLILVDPVGRTVDSQYHGAHLRLDSRPKQVLVRDPLPGNWSVRVVGVEVPPGGEPFSVLISQQPKPVPTVSQGLLAVVSLLLVVFYFAYLRRGL